MREHTESVGQNKERRSVPLEEILNIDNDTDNRTEFQSEITTETYSFFKDLLIDNGYTEFTDVNEAYSTLRANTIIVRREDPRNVLRLFSEDESYTIDFPKDDRYSNCVEWNPQADGPKNLGNAYAEGFTNLNHVVTVVGLEKNPKDDLLRLPDAVHDFHGLDRAGVRSFQGEVSEDRVTFISLRVPGHLLSESELTEDEIDRVDEYLELTDSGKKAQPVMIHRSYIKEVTDAQQPGGQKKEAA
jgi:hypothetical protein